MTSTRARYAGYRFPSEIIHPELKLTKVVVSEAGASIYSASAFASQELPGLDQRVAFWSPICWERSSPPPRGQPSSIEACLGSDPPRVLSVF
jgi:hypothetical protein